MTALILQECVEHARVLRDRLSLRQGDLTESDLSALVTLASVVREAAEVSAVDQLLATIVRAHRTRRDHWRADFLQLQRIALATAEGRLADARELFRTLDVLGAIETIDDSRLPQWEASLAWPPAVRSALLPHVYLGLANVCAFAGAYASGLRFATRGVECARVAKKSNDVTSALLLTAADIEASCGQLDASEQRIAEADREPDRWPGIHRAALALGARIAFFRGELGVALRHCEDLAAQASRLGLRREVARTGVDVAALRVALNQFADARRLAEDARDDAAADSTLAARIRRLMALLESDHGLAFNAPMTVSEAQIADEDRTRTTPFVAPAVAEPHPRNEQDVNYFQAFEIAAFDYRRSLRELQAAEAKLASMRKRFGDSDSPLIVARMQVLEAMFDYVAGRPAAERASDRDRLQRAALLLDTAVETLSRMNASGDVYDGQHWLGWCEFHLGNTPGHQRLRLANAVLAERMAASLNLDDRVTFYLDKWANEEEQFAVEIDEITRREEKMRGPRWLRRARGWPGLNRTLDRLFGLKESVYRQFVDAETGMAGFLTVPLVRRLIRSPRRVTVVFAVLPRSTVIFYLGFGRLDYVVKPFGRREVRECVADWHAARPSEAAAYALAKELGLADAFSSVSRWVNSITIVPDDALHGFPFAALPLAGGQPLVTRFALSIGAQPEPRRRRARRRDGRVAVIGVDGGGPNERVIDHAWELEFVAGRFDGASEPPLHNRDATPQKVFSALGSSSFAHIVCHGRFAPDAPAETGLVLSDSAGQPVLVSLLELARLDLRNLLHANVNACWTADAYVRPGRWTVSLADILCRAGAHAVIAPLWQAEERPNREFLPLLYRYLSLYPRDEALRRAQCDAMTSQMFLDASQWAAFQLYGAPDRVRLRGLHA